MNETYVTIIEDFKLLRMGLKAAFNAEEGYTLQGAYATAEEALSALESDHTDMVLLDLGLPGMPGIEAIKPLKQRFPDIKIVVLTSQEDKVLVTQAFTEGADAYCLKDIPHERFVDVLDTVRKGGKWLDPVVAGYAVDALTQVVDKDDHASVGTQVTTFDISQLEATFTPKEIEVLPLLATGKSNSEIAGALGVSVHTVKVHVSNILEKLDVFDRVQAAIKLVKLGLVEEPA